ncbi:hypothetical protein Tco_1353475 [Tanacetum coccineum]
MGDENHIRTLGDYSKHSHEGYRNTIELPIGNNVVPLRFDTIRFLALGWHLEEIHVTWAHLEKKRTRLRLYTKNHEELCIQSVETASRVLSDGVRTFEVTASEIW